MMGLILILNIVIFSILGFGFFTFISIISGKSILMDFKRLIVKNGCDVYVASGNRNLNHYFMKPKDDVFRIDDKIYITNPEKTMNLSEVDKANIVKSMANHKNRIKKRIDDLLKKVKFLENVKESLEDEGKINLYDSEIESIKDKILILEKSYKPKLHNYFKNKRPAFFYIEGDCIPKDFHEYLTDMDSTIIDNLVSRSITRPPPKLDETQKTIGTLKLMLTVLIVIVLINALVSFKNGTSLISICTKIGCGS